MPQALTAATGPKPQINLLATIASGSSKFGEALERVPGDLTATVPVQTGQNANKIEPDIKPARDEFAGLQDKAARPDLNEREAAISAPTTARDQSDHRRWNNLLSSASPSTPASGEVPRTVAKGRKGHLADPKLVPAKEEISSPVASLLLAVETIAGQFQTRPESNSSSLASVDRQSAGQCLPSDGDPIAASVMISTTIGETDHTEMVSVSMIAKGGPDPLWLTNILNKSSETDAKPVPGKGLAHMTDPHVSDDNILHISTLSSDVRPSSVGRSMAADTSTLEISLPVGKPFLRQIDVMNTEATLQSYSMPTPAQEAGVVMVRHAEPAQQFMDRQLDLVSDDVWLDHLTGDIIASRDIRDRMSFSLMPEGLGRLDVNMSSSDAGLAVHLKTSSEEAHRIVVASQTRLVDDLRAQGIRVAEAQVSQHSGSSDHQGKGHSMPHFEGWIETAPALGNEHVDVSRDQHDGRFA